ncbi:MAG: DUF2141 domain-containing protein [Myxococcota bacterium]|nr:DUF2141 domain-containing protein [Myxococcota bacterium]
MTRWMIRITTVCTLLMGATAVSAGDIHLKLKGVEKGKGTLRVVLFQSEADFKSDRPYAQDQTPAKLGEVTVIFKNVPPGRYSISSYQDVNDNGKIDTNFVGVPKEPYGFSNNAMGRFGPPSFDQMAFEVGNGNRDLEISLH